MLKVRNWRTFQHYQTRRPPWVKLHRTLLDDYEFIRLPVASQALAPRLWLLASESSDGSIPDDPAKLAFRLHCSEAEIVDSVTPLISAGFLEGLLNASAALATRKQNLISETETEGERTTDSDADAPAFQSPAVVSVDASVVRATDSPLAKPLPPSKQTWLTPFGEDWREAYGGDPSWGEMARVLKRPVEELGSEEVRVRWRMYLGQTEGRFASATRFAQTIGVWTAEAVSRMQPRDMRSMTVGDFNAATYERVMRRLQERDHAGQEATVTGPAETRGLLPG
jgi:hypothetical protein